MKGYKIGFSVLGNGVMTKNVTDIWQYSFENLLI